MLGQWATLLHRNLQGAGARDYILSQQHLGSCRLRAAASSKPSAKPQTVLKALKNADFGTEERWLQFSSVKSPRQKAKSGPRLAAAVVAESSRRP